MRTRLVSLDRQVSLSSESDDFSAALAGDLEASPGSGLIARGAGVSYTGASFSSDGRSLRTRGLGRVLVIDAEAGLVTVEAGVTFGELFVALAPHHLLLPVQPGHPQITIGGAIASNVHGKNPWMDGTFVDQVESLVLWHPDRGLVEASREGDPEAVEAFELTCGGLGLTGVIVRATLRVRRVPRLVARLRQLPVSSLAETLEVLAAHRSNADFLYAWNNLTRFDEALGRGYVQVAKLCEDGPEAAVPRVLAGRLDPSSSRLRVRLFGRRSARLVADLHERLGLGLAAGRKPLHRMLFPGRGFDSYFDAYGAEGFLGHMVLLPEARAAVYVAGLEDLMRRRRYPVIVCAAKAFGGEASLLRFDGRGFSFHFHVCATTRGRALAADLEALAEDHGGKRALYFDSRLDAATLRRTWPGAGEFRERLHRFDPARRFHSELSIRLGL